MLKPRNPEPGGWKVNWQPKMLTWVKPTSDMLLEKYTRQHLQSVFQILGGGHGAAIITGIGVDRSRRLFIGEAAAHAGRYHASVGKTSMYQYQGGVTPKMHNKEVHAPRVNLTRW
jgi:hypothetical protein